MRKFLSVFLLCSALFADEQLPYITSETNAHTLIEGVVNAANGKLVQVDQDILIQGTDPLEMTRFYDGGHNFASEFGYGVGCAQPAFVSLRAGEKGKFYALVELRMGAQVLCELREQDPKKKNLSYYFAGSVYPKYLESGYTNQCDALLQGESPLTAMEVELYDGKIVVSLGNGLRRYYSYYAFDRHEGQLYVLDYEEHGNGNRRHFSYYNKEQGSYLRLKRIWTTTPDGSITLNSLDFHYEDDMVHVTASNGQEAHYRLKSEKGTAKGGDFFHSYKATATRPLLVESSVDGYPCTQYESLKHSQYIQTMFSWSLVKSPNGRFLKVDYSKDQKVKSLSISGIEKSLYTFDYHSDYADVFDARGAKRRLELSKKGRLFI